MDKKQNIEETSKKKKVKSLKNRTLVLYNDDTNTFEHVVDCLTRACSHTYLQAKQCAFTTHINGKCDILKGDYELLMKIKTYLVENKLKVTID